MAKPELGIKRLCAGCGAKYYDLNRDPVVCPKCGVVFELQPSKVRPETASAKAEKKEDEPEEEDTNMVALEEAEEKAAEPKGRAAVPDVDDDSDDDIEIEDDDSDDAFLEDDEEDDDVSGLIGDVDEEEES
ncbi:MAG: TIGR02300 family protein [Hyphomicrobiales bacterium]|nr:TIGR02300 family protein [Hyphomicrobiales bacterium]